MVCIEAQARVIPGEEKFSCRRHSDSHLTREIGWLVGWWLLQNGPSSDDETNKQTRFIRASLLSSLPGKMYRLLLLNSPVWSINNKLSASVSAWCDSR